LSIILWGPSTVGKDFSVYELAYLLRSIVLAAGCGVGIICLFINK